MLWADNERVLMALAGSHVPLVLQSTFNIHFCSIISYQVVIIIETTMLRVAKECFEAHGKIIAQQPLAALNAQINAIAFSHQTDHVTVHPCQVVEVELPLVFRAVRAVA